MPDFGLIHDLAEIEVKVRREVMAAQRDIHCALAIMREGPPCEFTNERHEDVCRLLYAAEKAMAKVAGN